MRDGESTKKKPHKKRLIPEPYDGIRIMEPVNELTLRFKQELTLISLLRRQLPPSVAINKPELRESHQNNKETNKKLKLPYYYWDSNLNVGTNVQI
ncbi:MAG: hypothetical protein ACK2TV_05785 [Anaerolineales bacterium]